MQISAGYFLLSPCTINQTTFLKQFEGQYEIENLLSLDEKVGGIFPNLFDLKRDVFSQDIESHVLFDEMLVPNVFRTYEDALRIFNKAQTYYDTIYLIGASLDDRYVSDFNEFRGYVNDSIGGEGVPFLIGRNEPLKSGGEELGYDICAYEVCYFTSYLTNHLFEEYKARFPNTSVNKYGLFSELIANQLSELTNDHLIESVGAEDLMWLPWKITLYDKHM